MPYLICAFENDKTLTEKLAGANVIWQQVSGPDIFFGFKGVVMNGATMSGPCLTGTMGFTWYDQDREIDLLYSVVGGPQNCPAKLIAPMGFFEGSGTRCSLGLGTVGSQVLDLFFGVLLIPLGWIFWVRNRIRK